MLNFSFVLYNTAKLNVSADKMDSQQSRDKKKRTILSTVLDK